jgi:hypothetical protein
MIHDIYTVCYVVARYRLGRIYSEKVNSFYLKIFTTATLERVFSVNYV